MVRLAIDTESAHEPAAWPRCKHLYVIGNPDSEFDQIVTVIDMASRTEVGEPIVLTS